MSERTYSLEEVEGKEDLYIQTPAGRTLNPVSLAVIEVLHNVGMTEITKDNLTELHQRTCMLSILGICMIQVPQEDGSFVFRNPLEPELAAHVGLKVQTDRLTPRKFHNKLIAQVKESAIEFAATEAKMLEQLDALPEDAPENVIDATKPEIWTPGNG